MLTEKKIAKEDLFFHAVHGLCRVAEIEKSSKKELNYALLPVVRNRANKTRFVIPGAFLSESGFNRLISAKAAAAILAFLKSGTKKSSDAGASWDLAVLIRSEAMAKESVKLTQKRQALERAVKSLVCELAIVLEVSVAEMVETIRSHLGFNCKVNPAILLLLENVERVSLK